MSSGEGELQQPCGMFCWACGSVRESLMDEDMNDDQFVAKYKTDSAFKILVQKC